eukprot:5811602-Prymnesium_polylepis.1
MNPAAAAALGAQQLSLQGFSTMPVPMLGYPPMMPMMPGAQQQPQPQSQPQQMQPPPPPPPQQMFGAPMNNFGPSVQAAGTTFNQQVRGN